MGPRASKTEAKLRRELYDVLYQEEIIWFQKSRLEAIKDGDRKTKFFHLQWLFDGNTIESR